MRSPWLLFLVTAAGCAGSPAPAGGSPLVAISSAAPDQAAECGALIEIVNRWVAVLEQMDGYAGLDDLERMADIRGDMAREIEGVHPTRPELRAWAAEYGKAVRATAAVLRGVAASARRGDASVRSDGARDLDAATKKEESLVDRINALCHGP